MFERFLAALTQHRAVDYDTLYRYKAMGRVPRILRVIVSNPDLAEALAADAHALATQRDSMIVCPICKHTFPADSPDARFVTSYHNCVACSDVRIDAEVRAAAAAWLEDSPRKRNRHA